MIRNFRQRKTPTIEARTANSTFAIGELSCSANRFVVAESSVLRIHPESFRDGECRRLRQAA